VGGWQDYVEPGEAEEIERRIATTLDPRFDYATTATV
jgi:hypothetical protein